MSHFSINLPNIADSLSGIKMKLELTPDFQQTILFKKSKNTEDLAAPHLPRPIQYILVQLGTF